MARDFNGRKQICIPISKKNFDKKPLVDILEKYIFQILDSHKKNVNDIEYLHEVYMGIQDISDKKRYNGSDINNKIVENHSNKIVNFKVGFMYGNPLDYSLEKSVETNDMTFLNVYINDSNKPSLDIEKAQDLYEFGISYQLIMPKPSSEIIDINSDSPFTLDRLPPNTTEIVYSCDIPAKPLFAIVIGQYIDDNDEAHTAFDIYVPYRKYFYYIDRDSKIKEIESVPQSYPFIPIVEYKLNNCRMGVLELSLPLQDLINKINSSQMDDIEENVNCFIVIKNQLIDDEWKKTFLELKKERILALTTNNPETPPDVEFVTSELKQEAVNAFYERVVKALYDIASVPQSSGNVTSGGDTGQARLLGNGWESAQNQAKVEQTYLLQYERQLLKYMIHICKSISNCPVDNISSSEVNIRFNINMSDNLLVKTQSLSNLSSINFPKKDALRICGVTNDIDGVGNNWEKNDNQVKEEEKEETKNINNETN